MYHRYDLWNFSEALETVPGWFWFGISLQRSRGILLSVEFQNATGGPDGVRLLCTPRGVA